MKTNIPLKAHADNDKCPLCGNDTLDMGYGLAGGGGLGVYYFCKTEECQYLHKILTRDEKLAGAIAYLRSRGKYLLDGGKWVPTPSGATDVRKTMAAYRRR